MAKPATTNIVPSLSRQLQELTRTARRKYSTAVTPFQRDNAQDIYDAVQHRMRSAAEVGGTRILVDVDPDGFVPFVSLNEPPMLTGVAAALAEKFEGDGFRVSVVTRYNGHPYGEFCLEVAWDR